MTAPVPSRMEDVAAATTSRDAGPEQDPLLQLSAQEYLERTVMVPLTLGLEDLCRMRPANPVDYLGLFLLRRSESSNVVEVPFEEAVPAKPAARVV